MGSSSGKKTKKKTKILKFSGKLDLAIHVSKNFGPHSLNHLLLALGE